MCDAFLCHALIKKLWNYPFASRFRQACNHEVPPSAVISTKRVSAPENLLPFAHDHIRRQRLGSGRGGGGGVLQRCINGPGRIRPTGLKLPPAVP